MTSTPSNIINLYKPMEQHPKESDQAEAAVERATAGAGEPESLTAFYSAAQVERLLSVSGDQLRRLERAGLLPPTCRRGGKRFYSFQDLVGLRSALDLLKGGLTAGQLARALRALRRRFPHRSSPLSELRLSREGQAIVVREDDQRFEAETGQLLLDFDVGEIHRQVVELVGPRQRPGDEQRQRAFELYLEGCRLEVLPEALDQAEQAYRRAIELDPSLASAYTNLGNLRYRSGSTDDARVLYEKAIAIESEQPEAMYNLAFLAYEEGELDEAVALFGQAIELDPDFADAHFNLAMALTELDRIVEAAMHFRAYLRLEPNGPWAELARQELKR